MSDSHKARWTGDEGPQRRAEATIRARNRQPNGLVDTMGTWADLEEREKALKSAWATRPSRHSSRTISYIHQWSCYIDGCSTEWRSFETIAKHFKKCHLGVKLDFSKAMIVRYIEGTAHPTAKKTKGNTFFKCPAPGCQLEHSSYKAIKQHHRCYHGYYAPADERDVEKITKQEDQEDPKDLEVGENTDKQGGNSGHKQNSDKEESGGKKVDMEKDGGKEVDMEGEREQH